MRSSFDGEPIEPELEESERTPVQQRRWSRRSRSAVWILASIAAAGVLVGVGWFLRATVQADRTPEASMQGFRAHLSDPAGGMAAIVSGVVEVDLDAGCVWLAGSDGSREPVVWPIGTTSRLDPFEVVLADGQVVRAGDQVAGGGGYINAGSATRGMELFPEECIQVGEAAVFNARSEITVTPEVGLDTDETLIDRFSLPAPLGLELIAVGGNSVAIVDFVTGTVHGYDSSQYSGPPDWIDGASGGGGFIHLWAQGTIYTYWSRPHSDPLVYQPEPPRETPGFAPSLSVVLAPDGDHTWLVQPPPGDEPTLVELINVVNVQVTRIGSYEVEGSWHPVGATVEGLVLVADDPEPRTALVGANGGILTEISGTALSVGWNGTVVLKTDDTLMVTDALLGGETPVAKPGDGDWAAVGGPVIPTDAPPIVTGGTKYLVQLTDDPAKGNISGGDLIVVDSTGAATPIYELSEGSHVASWSRDEAWVVVVEGSAVTLVPANRGTRVPLGDLVPEEMWVLTIG